MLCLLFVQERTLCSQAALLFSDIVNMQKFLFVVSIVLCVGCAACVSNQQTDSESAESSEKNESAHAAVVPAEKAPSEQKPNVPAAVQVTPEDQKETKEKQPVSVPAEIVAADNVSSLPAKNALMYLLNKI